MSEKPILFSSEMVRAILEGRKTQTRRVIKPQPVFSSGYWWYDEISFRGEDDLQDYLFHNVYGSKGSPYGSVYGDGTSDMLWVRETWACIGAEYVKPSDIAPGYRVYYKADSIDNIWRVEQWRPSIFMPRWASRITLKITDIRIEQVQDISEDDAKAEGVSSLPDYTQGIWNATDRFIRLWDKINAKRGYSWQSNPLVWVVEFEKI